VFSNDTIESYNVVPLSAGKYLDWQTRLNPTQPAGLRHIQMVHIWETGFFPGRETLTQVARANRGATWIIGNESDVIWQDNVTPEAYAFQFHEVYTTIIAADPTAKFASNGLGQVSRLRLAWLDRAWTTYRNLFGTDMPIDVWNIHTYVANEMHLQWGSEIPPGIPNAVGYTMNYGTQWRQATDAGASGGTVHESNTAYANAWFAFNGSQVTIYFRTGPNSGIAGIFLDRSATPALEVDLYSATPGTISRRFANLPPGNGRLQDRHAIRTMVTGRKNPASSGTWVRVDAIKAPSTAGLPNDRFEDNDPLRARIVVSIEDHDRIGLIVEQIRDFRQWMLNHGQRNKPLINSEHGILGTEDLGFTYPRVRTFMIDSFNRFFNDIVDPNLGYPDDGNRMLQEWYWFALAVDEFEGRVTHTGLYDAVTKAIKPLGLDFRNYMAPLKREYRDLEAHSLTLSPSWPLFAGDPSLINLKAVVRNVGNASVGSFQVAAKLASGTSITSWTVPGLAKRFEPGHSLELSYDWQTVISGNRTVRVIVDEADLIPEPCGSTNNTRQLQLVAPPSTDLAVSGLTTVPSRIPPIPPGTTTTVTLKATLANLGSVGTSAGQILVKFWDGDPAAGGTLIGSQTFVRGNVTLPATATVSWPNRSPGVYTVFVTVDPVPEESNLQNNRQNVRIMVPAGVAYVPFTPKRGRMGAEELLDATLTPTKETQVWWLPYDESELPE
jgi:hypothetical protein